MTLRRRAVVLCAWALAGALGSAQDWPQFLGENRDGHYAGPPIDVAWSGGSPPELWRREVGAGFAGPVVSGDRVVLFHRVGDREVVEAMDVDTGETTWRHEYATTYRDDFGFDEGPRSAPVIADGRVATFGAQGQLHVLSFDTGELLWSVDTRARYRFRKGYFGAAGSPLVLDGRVMANVGGPEAGIVAFDLVTGQELWVATQDEASYSSGTSAVWDGVQYAIFLTRNLFVGLDPATGEVRFSEPWRARLRASVNAATPVVVDDLVFVSAQYGPGAGVFRMVDGSLRQVWRSDDALSNHYATSVAREGILYGYHGRQEYGPSLRAIDLLTGEERWSVELFGAGTVILADDRLVLMREGGELLIAEASPAAFRPLARAQVLDPVVRAYPALARGRLYVRNEDTLICLDLRGE